jgi:tRNA A37 threonylcarbamoyladenosine synthetase subunit TsaC/SUA5/YrdC
MIKSDDVYLFQTDTTVGLASQNSHKLSIIKLRDEKKPFLRLFNSLDSYIKSPARVPNHFKNRVRREKKTTFVINNFAIRISKPMVHSTIINKLNWFYSTSANKKSSSYNKLFCHSVSDIIIEDAQGLFESIPSKIYKLRAKTIKRLR